jgi:type II secretory pathway pseudopilin PulG
MNRTYLRTARGGSVIELLIAMLVITFVSSGMLALMSTNTKVNVKVQNQVDTINAAKQVLDRIGKDVRMARSLGDLFGANRTESGLTFVDGTNYFPSPNNPIYGTGAAPARGWPSWATDTCPAPGRWFLGNESLIVQVPIFDRNGFPTMIPQDTFGLGRPATPQVNVETHVYRLVDDPDTINHPNEFFIQYCSFPGMDIPGVYDAASAAANAGPTTILKGLVGPMNPGTGRPRIFQFIDKTDWAGRAQDTVNAAVTGNYTGVVVNLEIRRHGESALSRRHTSSMGLKSEVFMRNNALATTTGQPTTMGP